MKRSCDHCGDEFLVCGERGRNKRFCSRICGAAYWREFYKCNGYPARCGNNGAARLKALTEAYRPKEKALTGKGKP